MEVKMNKEIRDYQESIFFGLSMRQGFFSLLAVAAATGIYLGLKDVLGTEITGWLSVLSATPFAGCGFFQYHQMTLEQFVRAWIKSEILYPKKLVFRSENLYAQCLDEVILKGIHSCADGAERMEKKRNRKQRKNEDKRKGRGKAID